MSANQFNEPTDQTQPTDDDRAEGPGLQQVRRLRRPIRDRQLAGVASAIAGFFGIDVTAVRIGLVVLALLGGSAIPLYMAGWLLIPEEGAELSVGQQLANDLRRRCVTAPI